LLGEEQACADEPSALDQVKITHIFLWKLSQSKGTQKRCLPASA
jgi:hypothetical protein